LPRLMRRRRVFHLGLLLGIGVAILANSRPFEGLVFCLATVLSFLFVRSLRNRTPWKWWRGAVRGAWPIVGITLVLTVCFVGYYNFRLTGNSLLLPYVANDRVYSAAPHFIWQSSLPVRHSNNPQIEGLYLLERSYWENNRLNSIKHFLGHLGLVSTKFSYFFLWPQFLIPFVSAILFLPEDSKLRFLVFQFALCFVGMVAVLWSQPHYAAPLTGTVVLIIVQALRHTRHLNYRGRPAGLGLVRVFVTFSLLMTLVYVAEAATNPNLNSFVAPAGVWGTEGNRFRANILYRLRGLPGKHLVIVRYSSGTTPTGEWVYNDARIDDAKVVWAREIPGVDLSPLLSYFRERQVWLVEAGTYPPSFSEYSHRDVGDKH